MQSRQQNQLEKLKSTLKSKFQKRYKHRGGSSLSEVKQKQKLRERNQSVTAKIGDDHKIIDSQSNYSTKKQHKNDQFYQTLQSLNLDHHNKGVCMCDDCSCGRHLCKLSVKKPDLKKSTVYQTLFVQKQPQESVVLIAKQVSPLIGHHLDMASIYLKDYRSREMDQLDRPKPQDRLKFEGPTQNLTSYGQFFIGHHGKNQYVKPTDKHTIGKFPLLSKTVYQRQYIPRKLIKFEIDKMKDTLKADSNWFGSSTYNKTFQNPNPQNYAQQSKIIDKYLKYPDYAHQFETSYKNQYVQKPSPLCPSKISIEMDRSNGFNNSKHLFRENSDFKSMSPQFKATSKHFYV